jgi:DNA-binding NarL/FixJ family response regulator
MRVLIVEDHELFRAGLELLIRQYFPAVELLSASTLKRGLHEAFTQALNVVILDLALPDGHGCEALAQLKELRPSLPVIVVSADERLETISQCIELRAMGYVPKASSPEALRAAIAAVLSGGVFLPASIIELLRRNPGAHDPKLPEAVRPRAVRSTHTSDATALGLTARQFETLTWLARGLPSKTIAVKMGLEDVTVRKYISHLLEHFNLRRRTELIVMLADRGIKLGAPPLTVPEPDKMCSVAFVTKSE